MEFDGVWILKSIERLLAEISSKKKVCVQLQENYIKFILKRQFENENVHE